MPKIGPFGPGDQVGDGTNYTVFASDGILSMAGTARVLNGEWIDAGGIKSPGAKPATAIAQGLLETPAWQFGNEAVEANQESVSFNIRLPNRMDRSVAPTILIGWSASGVSPGYCKWQLDYAYRALNEDTTVSDASDTVRTAASATADGVVLSTFSSIAVANVSDICIHCRLKRLSASASDTIADTVELHGVCVSWVSDKLGTAT